MRAKRPIVATDVTGTNELISHNKTGLLTKPTPASIAKAIDHLLKDKDKAKRLTERAYEYFCKHHSLERQISLLATLYNNSVYNRKGENATEI
jgi:glycosyltransferase involved in cell wall biosynthesis